MPKDRVNKMVFKEGEGRAVGKARTMRGTLMQQLREVIATMIKKQRRCTVYTIIIIITERTRQEP